MKGIPGDYIEIQYDKLLRDNPKSGAVLFLIEGKEVWIPRSQIFEWFEDASKNLILTEWIAKQKGLI